MRNRPLAILFDMDGVVTHTMPFHYRCWKRIFEEEGLSLRRVDIYAREGQKGINSIREIFALKGVRVSTRRATELLKKKEILFKRIARTQFVPGARTFIRDCKRRGLLTALVTGTSRHEMHRVLPEAILACFDVVVTGSDVREGKPAPEPYQKALSLLKVPVSRALVIENAPFGIRSARAAGIRCVALKTSLPESYLSEADLIVRDYQELRRALYGQTFPRK
ncbi:MAG: HAD family phosphatase [Elusimicrobia bacterium]|nr:HAD family phosphatase [Elusimicrobiota bacterium]